MMNWLQSSSDMAERVRQHDWANTPLGPLEQWPDVLKTTAALCFASSFPQAIIWGPQLITLYNDAFIPILGDKPDALGRPFSEIWHEVWDQISPIADAAFEGHATYIENFPLVIERGAGPEQAYFTFCYSPIRDPDGKIVGMLDTVTETTTTVFLTQRLAALDTIGNAVATATDAEHIMATTTRLLAQHMQVSNCAYADMDADEDGFTIRGNWAAPGSPSIVGHYSLASFGAMAVQRLRAGEPLVVQDNRIEFAPEDAASYQALGALATVCFPLIKHGRLTALMAVHDKKARVWSPYDLALVGEVTERSWAHIERVRADVAVREGLAAFTELNASLEQRVQERTAALTQAEAALRQSQKLEAIGQLTGGVAHDFNNLLTIIRSSVDFLRQPGLSEERRQRYMGAVSDTVERASKLTSQLLAFARRQPLNPEVFDAGQRVKNIGEMLESVTGARIHVQVELPDAPCHVRVDSSQFETALINIALNARDAMDGQGTLVLRVATVDAMPRIRGDAAVHEGFVSVSLTDTGSGIAGDTFEHIFEPFFTTKAVGKGTGLGLSQVFGFAKQSGGNVDVSSRVGQGTVFTLYLPEVAPPAMPLAQRPEELAPVHTATPRHILIVEDNLEVGRFANQILQDLGYRTTWATDAEQALALAGADALGFDGVFSDVVMPGMTGVAMAKVLRQRRPDLPVVLTSGYSEELADSGYEGFEFLAKPYSADQVARALAKAIP
ncbi:MULTISPECIES: GAF domain-containing protein [unclassified Pseudomonas]|uniref:GAF domain-containing protein n=1 Tax=unclassified Pseudomonas TaxID=196821 RepID=UPI000C86AAA7|nr:MULTISPECIES: GAF domain-containing protein [unclassified Pseudomonas]PMV21101.1 hybrid sensor histidine kinase/response regulator [Pseudomonas sp. FW305-3-2-15-C-TSA2]PMV26382.1 hybrid sensor histidine kinase/response regulator [Pseudomonas sp. DP16D-L5]PMV37435.1 hybrid sensor histidine kinase/response regulator [Pseudomonas sp. FW305-3-2-15-A-LB2]PMV43669.1 hybrid sensor histidine kinase/response regulator [Pseudomonas sp. FW305-3-2-15-C-R2A1]PMV48632.1 hybrid sensor histidine kinase/res